MTPDRRFVLVFLAAALAGPGFLYADKPQKVPEALVFDKVKYLKMSGKSDDNQSVVQYYPEGSSPENWSRRVSLRTLQQFDNPRIAALSLIHAMKRGNPYLQSALKESPDKKQVIIDFLIWPPDKSFVEFNIMRYSASRQGGLIMQQYSQRIRGRNLENFFSSFKSERERLLTLMIEKGLKPVRK